MKSRNRNHARGNPQTFGVVKMGRIGVAEVQYGSSAYATASTSRVESPFNSSKNPYEDLSILRRRRRTKFSESQPRQQRGLFNEVRTIDLGVTDTAETPRGISEWWKMIKQSWPFFVALWDVMTGLVFLLWDKARSRGRSHRGDRAGKSSTIIRTSAEGHRGEEDESVEDDEDSAADTRRMDREKEVYSRFLRGEEISDDEHDDDFTSSFDDEDSRRGVDDDDDVEEEEEEEEGEEEEEENGLGEAVRLFSDFLRSGRDAPRTSAGGGEMVLAHLLHRQASSSGPLTRQGWRELVEQGDASDYRSHFRNKEDDTDNDDIWDHPYSRNDTTPTDSQPIFNTAECVICTNGQRDIICWPCRYVFQG